MLLWGVLLGLLAAREMAVCGRYMIIQSEPTPPPLLATAGFFSFPFVRLTLVKYLSVSHFTIISVI